MPAAAGHVSPELVVPKLVPDAPEEADGVFEVETPELAEDVGFILEILELLPGAVEVVLAPVVEPLTDEVNAPTVCTVIGETEVVEEEVVAVVLEDEVVGLMLEEEIGTVDEEVAGLEARVDVGEVTSVVDEVD